MHIQPHLRAFKTLGDTPQQNFGHQAAITAVLEQVTGHATVVMDGDLQDLREAIPEFVERYMQGYDIVYAQRIRRKEPWPLRPLLFYELQNHSETFRRFVTTGRR